MNEANSCAHNWLSSLTARKSYSPTFVGDNYQPLCTSWSKLPLNGLKNRPQSSEIVSFQRNDQPIILSFGGISSDLPINRVETVLSDFCDRKPLTRRNTEWCPRTDFMVLCTSTGSHIYVLGGTTTRGLPLSDCWVSTDGAHLFQCASNQSDWEGRIGHSSTLIGQSTLIIAGGKDVDEVCGYKNDVWVSKDGGKSWSCSNSGSPWAARYGSKLVNVCDGPKSSSTLWLVGGSNDYRAFDDIWTSKDLGVSWSLHCSKVPWKGRQFFTLVQDPISAEILVMGGSDADGEMMTDVWASTDFGATWSTRARLPMDNTLGIQPVINPFSGDVLLFNKDKSNVAIHSQSSLKFIQKDCIFMLMLGHQVEHTWNVPKEAWAGIILPFVVDTRLLWKRRPDCPWSKL